jgi:hypothetical protein
LKKQYVLPLFLLAQIIALQILAFFPGFVERFYSNGAYRWISHASRLLLGWVPFSVGDVLYFAVITLAARWLWRIRKTFRSDWKSHGLKALSALSVFYFFFYFLWACNYHRVPLYRKMQMGKEYSNEDLLKLTKLVIAKANETQQEIVGNDSVKVSVPYSHQEIFKKNRRGYDRLSKIYPFFHYERPSIKNSLISTPLTYMGFAGYLNPFTNEAQVNRLLPLYGFPATSAHEMAHQIGYASESEANFIGFMACVYNDDLYMRYSGYALAVRYCLANWEIRDEKMFDRLLETVNPGVRKNFAESEAFWESYESFVETGFKVFYDNFLKWNKQDGLESYNKFVDLLANYTKKHALP